jgi:hypothetical protein|uniref:Uncharacterized protein n=1 Tax=Fagus sylvatica TaxID=28930 RepID=A0A2N9GIB2_FAGSY
MSQFGSNSRHENMFNPVQIRCDMCDRMLFGTRESVNRNHETLVLQEEITYFYIEQNPLPNPLHPSTSYHSLHAFPSTSHPSNQINYFNVQRQPPQRNLVSSLNMHPFISYNQNPPRQNLSDRNILTTTRQPRTQPLMQMANTRAIQPHFSMPNPQSQDLMIRAGINARMQQQQAQLHRQMERGENRVPLNNGHIARQLPQTAPEIIDLDHGEDDKDKSKGLIDVDLNL